MNTELAVQSTYSHGVFKSFQYSTIEIIGKEEKLAPYV